MSYISEVLADSPKAFWEEQDASGNPVDSSGNGLDMTSISGSPSYRKIGPQGNDYGIETAGSQQFSRSTISTVVNNLTIEMWLYPEIITDIRQGVFLNGNSASNGYGVYVDTSTLKYHVLICGVAFGAASTTPLVLNVWQHLVVVRRSGQWEYWRNGVQDATNPGTTAPNTPSGGSTAIGNPFSASMQAAQAYVAFYETALSSTRIAAHYNAVKSAVRWFSLGVEYLLGAVSADHVDWVNDTIKIALLTSTASPNQDSNQYWSDLNANEVSGTGYSAGGIALSSKTLTYDSASKTVRLKCADAVFSSVTLTNARYAVIYKDTGSASTSPLLGYVIFVGNLSPSAENLTVQFDPTDGALRSIVS